MKKILRWLIRIIDQSYHKKHKLILIPGCKNENFYINSHPYEGALKVLKGGVQIKKGDAIIEIHMNNQKSEELSDVKKIMRALKEALQALAVLMTTEEYKDCKAVYGNTLLYPIAQKNGFEVLKVEDEDIDKAGQLWENIIKYAYSDKGKKLENRISKEIWYEKDALIQRWLK